MTQAVTATHRSAALVEHLLSLPPSLLDTPLGANAHVVERYRPIDAAAAKQAQERHEKEAGRLGGALLPDEAYAKGLELDLTIENPVYFKEPLHVRVTYRRTVLPWLEQVCAENEIGRAHV